MRRDKKYLYLIPVSLVLIFVLITFGPHEPTYDEITTNLDDLRFEDGSETDGYGFDRLYDQNGRPFTGWVRIRGNHDTLRHRFYVSDGFRHGPSISETTLLGVTQRMWYHRGEKELEELYEPGTGRLTFRSRVPQDVFTYCGTSYHYDLDQTRTTQYLDCPPDTIRRRLSRRWVSFRSGSDFYWR
jgi:hypothetical protein